MITGIKLDIAIPYDDDLRRRLDRERWVLQTVLYKDMAITSLSHHSVVRSLRVFRTILLGTGTGSYLGSVGIGAADTVDTKPGNIVDVIAEMDAMIAAFEAEAA